jgi:NADH-quinone oxidoreductase subunit G
VLDSADGAAARATLESASLVVALTPFNDANVEFAHVMLPIAPFTETSGTFVNAEGRVQSFQGVVKPLGEARPAWKVLRVLGNLLQLPGFEYDSTEAVRAAALGDAQSISSRLSNATGVTPSVPATVAGGLERVADVPIYAGDALVRRAPSLQRTADAKPPVASVPTTVWQQLGLQPDDRIRLTLGGRSVVLPARHDPTLAPTTLRVPAGHADTTALGAMFGNLTAEKA